MVLKISPCAWKVLFDPFKSKYKNITTKFWQPLFRMLRQKYKFVWVNITLISARKRLKKNTSTLFCESLFLVRMQTNEDGIVQ
jgi:hypothetical protein